MERLALSILPGLILGLIISSFLVAWRPVQNFLQHHAAGHGFFVIAGMALAGVISPFCSYLAIPISAALLMRGLAPGAVFAFLCSTPLMNPTLFFMTWSVFGWPMALARALSAFLFGIVGGLLAQRFFLPDRMSVNFHPTEVLPSLEKTDSTHSFLQIWWKSFCHMGWFVVKFVLLGILIAALVKELIPMRWITMTVGRQQRFGILFGSLLGIPLYACGGGTIPLIQILMNLGMSPGAALAFFLVGPATKIPTLAAMQLTMGTNVTIAFCASSFAWSILAGSLFQLFF
ncbi:MAG: permease [Candidatus Omnitrophica bacterium]|nr:permease [Candidatus Omnitrophota bacterium]